jgi:hypothetical protein
MFLLPCPNLFFRGVVSVVAEWLRTFLPGLHLVTVDHYLEPER